MNGFLLDENLPRKLRVRLSKPAVHAQDVGRNPIDAELWAYAKVHGLTIVTKDADFSDRILTTQPPPKVVHLRFGNLRLASFHAHLVKVWPRVEELLETHKLVNIYLDRLEAVV